MRRLITVIAIPCLTGVTLGGCSGARGADVSQTTPSVSASSEQRFTNSTEALTKARATYQKYLLASQEFTETGGAMLERLSPFVSDAEYARNKETASYLQSHSLRAVGSTKLLKFTLQKADLRSGTVSAYACVDLSEVRVLNKAGIDVTPANRPDRQTSVPRFEWQSNRFVLEEDGTWPGKSIC